MPYESPLVMTFPRKPLFFAAPACLSLSRPLVSLSRLSCSIPSYTRRQRDAWPTHQLDVLPPSLRPCHQETLDLILRAKVLLLQSRKGYRANTDSLTLAYYASSQRLSNDPAPFRLLDLGAGSGLVSVLVGLHVGRDITEIDLIELQPESAQRAQRNLALNGLEGRSRVVVHDLAEDIPRRLIGQASVVALNPPFYLSGTRAPPRHPEKALAHIESSAGLSHFLTASLLALRPGTGIVCMIHDRRQLDRILAACRDAGLVVVELLEVFDVIGKSTKRVLVKARAWLSGDFADAAGPLLGSLCLHPPGCEKKLYFDDMENFLNDLPSPPYAIGRQGYL